jgi:hypothetical protein
MLQGIVPQAVIVCGHGVTFCTAGVMAIFNQADRPAASHLSASLPFMLLNRRHYRHVVRLGAINAPPLLSERPDTTAVGRTEAVHPGENMRLQGYPLWDSAKVLWPEIDALFIGNRRDGQFKLVG